MEKRIAPAPLGSSLLRGARLAGAMFGGALLGCSDGGQTYDDGADGLGDRRTPPVVASASSKGDGSEDVVSTDGATTGAVSSEDTLVLTPPTAPPPPPPPPPPDPTLLRCSELTDEADALLEEAYQSMANSCVVDADCVVQGLPVSDCSPAQTCFGEITAMSASALAQLEEDIKTSTSSACGEFEALGCMRSPPLSLPCWPKYFTPWCDAGVCASREATCEEAFPDAWSSVVDVYDSADRSCTADDDCTLFTSGGVSCTPGFAARCESKIGVNVDAVSGLETSLATIEGDMCLGYELDSCTTAIDPIECPDVDSARCIEQQCVAVVDGESAPGEL